MIEVSALQGVPPFGQGIVRDMRVRWALEEAGLPYRQRLYARADLASAEYRAMQPFAQVPMFREDGLILFESGAIVLHVAERSDTLLPADAAGRAIARTWLFAALNTIEPPLQRLAEIDHFPGDADLKARQRPEVVERVGRRLDQLAAALGDGDCLDRRFTAGDLMMTTVLRIVRHTDLVSQRPALAAYQARCEARPAFQRALADHMAAYVPPVAA